MKVYINETDDNDEGLINTRECFLKTLILVNVYELNNISIRTLKDQILIVKKMVKKFILLNKCIMLEFKKKKICVNLRCSDNVHNLH